MLIEVAIASGVLETVALPCNSCQNYGHKYQRLVGTRFSSKAVETMMPLRFIVVEIANQDTTHMRILRTPYLQASACLPTRAHFH